MVLSQAARFAWGAVAACWLLMVGAIIGMWIGPKGFDNMPEPKVEAMRQIYREVEESYVFPVDGDALMDGAMRGMLEALGDPYSAYISPAELQRFEEGTTGQYYGIGVRQLPGVTPMTVLYPFAGGPAQRAGLGVGDQLLAIDGDSIADVRPESLGQITDRLKSESTANGDPGIVLTVRRGTDGPVRDVTVVRGPVQQPSVKWARLVEGSETLGYVHLSHFQNNTTNELKDALAHLQSLADGDLAGLIIDLRENQGGLLDECVAACRLFLQDGVILSSRGRDGEELATWRADGDAPFRDLALVLLVNGSSASASEVMAGALGDHKRALLVGQRTFGKGVVQTVYRWEDRDFRLRLTTAHYYTPNGTNIEGRASLAAGTAVPPEQGSSEPRGGIAPDTGVPVDDELRQRIARGLGAPEPPREYREAVDALAARFDVDLGQPLTPSIDSQLQQAIQTLREQVGKGEANGSGNKRG